MSAPLRAPARTSVRGPTGRRTAYLVSQYPTLSHVFIESEVAALRSLGWQVDTFSVRASPLAEHPETADTVVLQRGGPRALATAGLRAALTAPAALGAGLRAAVAHGHGRSARERLWQLFYLLEALVLHREMLRRGLRQVHVHFANNGADIARLATTLGCAVDGPGSWTWSLAVHGPTEFEQAGPYDLAGKVASASFVACISDFARSQVMRYADPASWARLHVVRMGVADLAELVERPGAGDASSTRGRPGSDGESLTGALRVLFVGRLVAEKGPHVLLDAVDLVAEGIADRRPPGTGAVVDVALVGAGPLADSLRHRTASSHPAARVRLLGGLPHEQLGAWYDWADVFVLPSFAEGLPVVLMEALAHRVPVVTTSIAGVPELVVDDRTGLLVAPGRSDQLADAIVVLADDPSRRRRLADAGHEAVKSLHDAHRNGILLSELLAHSGDEGR